MTPGAEEWLRRQRDAREIEVVRLRVQLAEKDAEITKLKRCYCSHSTGPGNEPCDLVRGLEIDIEKLQKGEKR